jgi:hypothetical protein
MAPDPNTDGCWLNAAIEGLSGGGGGGFGLVVVILLLVNIDQRAGTWGVYLLHHRPVPATIGDSMALPPIQWRATMTQSLRPRCPNCHSRLALTYVTSGRSGFDLHSFERPKCNDVVNTDRAADDPMNSKAMGRHRGELHAPKAAAGVSALH